MGIEPVLDGTTLLRPWPDVAAPACAPASDVSARRLACLESVCQNFGREAVDHLSAVLGQLDLVEDHLRRLAIVERYLARIVERSAAMDGELAPATLPTATVRRLRALTSVRVTRRRIGGLRQARAVATHLAALAHALHDLATPPGTDVTIDVNATVRAAVDLAHVIDGRVTRQSASVTLNLAEGLPVARGAPGAVIALLIGWTSGSGGATTITTRHAGSDIVCQIDCRDERGPRAPVASDGALRVTTVRLADGLRHELWLPVAPLQALRSGSAW